MTIPKHIFIKKSEHISEGAANRLGFIATKFIEPTPDRNVSQLGCGHTLFYPL